MKNLDFDVNSTEKNKIELLNCQVDLILRSLEFYSYTYQFIYPRRGKSETLEENLRISLVRDTYHQITNQVNFTNFNEQICENNYEQKNNLKNSHNLKYN